LIPEKRLPLYILALGKSREITTLKISSKLMYLHTAIIAGAIIIATLFFIVQMRSEAFRQAKMMQESHIETFWELLRAKGEDFKIVDGKLLAGSYVITGNYELPDKAKKIFGGNATIFRDDVRVSTNILKEDGNRAVGTRLQGPAYDAIFKEGRSYRGEALILGVPYFTAYDPIRNAKGKVIGALYVGIKKSEFFSAYDRLKVNAITMAAVLITIFTVLAFLLVKDRKKAGESLRESEETLNALLGVMPVGVCWFDNDGNIEYANCYLEGLLGYSLTDIPTIKELFLCSYPDPAYRADITASWNAAIAEGQSHNLPVATIEANITRRDGNVRHVIINTQFTRNRVLVIFTDITEREFIHNELLKAQKLESLGILAGGIAHDFNNILTIIMGNISFAKKFLDASHKSYKLLKEAEKASHRASEVAYQLLTFAKGGQPIKKTVSVRKLVHESVSLAMRGVNVQGFIDVPDSINAIEADEGQIIQAFSNVIINAVQAMPGGGTLTVHAENVELAPQNKLGIQSGKYVKITFADEGCGIPDEEQKKIFDPYFSTKPCGTGLGLSSAYSIVNMHGGHIHVHSVVGKGTIFTFYLPSIGEVLTEQSANRKHLAAVNHRGGVILVMDDEEMIRNLVEGILCDLGYRVATCVNGEEAVAMYKVAKEIGNPFCAAIMDLTIPGGMGGREAAQQILEFDPAARLIVSSGYSNDPVIAGYKNFGFCAAVSKPYESEEIALALSNV
jgi:PAS domain S-box-containing protein